jgi:hypothetical protein
LPPVAKNIYYACDLYENSRCFGKDVERVEQILERLAVEAQESNASAEDAAWAQKTLKVWMGLGILCACGVIVVFCGGGVIVVFLWCFVIMVVVVVVVVVL